MKYLVWVISIGLIGFSLVMAQDLGDVTLRFCNGTGKVVEQKQAYLSVNPNEPQPLCMKFSNSSKKSLNLTIGTVDWVLTNDNQQLKACRNEWDNANFGRFVALENNQVLLPAQSSTIVTWIVKFPAGNGGMVLGCITYYANQGWQKSDGSMLNILVRKASFVNVLVSGEVTYNLSYVPVTNDLMKDQLSNNVLFNVYHDVANDNALIAQLGLQNTGSVPQKTQTTWVVTNIFGFKQELSFEKLVLPRDMVVLTEPLKFPWYGGWYNVFVQTSYQPINEIQTSALGSLEDKKGVISLKATVFVLPWIVILALGVFLCIIFWIIIKRKKKKSETSSSKKKSVVSKKSVKK